MEMCSAGNDCSVGGLDWYGYCRAAGKCSLAIECGFSPEELKAFASLHTIDAYTHTYLFKSRS
jgi:hypothetical protein